MRLPQSLPSLNQIQIELDRRRCARSFAEYVKAAWHILEPHTDLKWGFALDAICTHLEAVTRGDILRLLMNVPPGTMKSLLTGVLWPSWEWGACGKPHLRYIGTAHKSDLAIRDSMKCRRLIQSEWYQARWPIRIMGDQNAKTKFENDSTGFREAMAFTSMTGARGDRVIIDDPLSVNSANSVADLADADFTFTESVPSRVSSEKSAIVVIMQRLNERDTSGIILERGLPYTHLCLPMRFEPARKCITPFFEDPRTYDGELLFPELFSEARTAELEKTIGVYATAGQLQQRPAPRGGGYFEKSWLRYYDQAPDLRTLRVYGASDYAVTDNGGDYTVHIVAGVDPENRMYVLDLWRQQADSGVWATALCDLVLKWRPVQWAEETGQIRSSMGPFIDSMARKRGAYVYRTAFPTRGDKSVRAQSIRGRMSLEGLYIPTDAPWRSAFEGELVTFPAGVHDDQVDALGLIGQLLDTMVSGRQAPVVMPRKIDTGYGNSSAGQSYRI